MNTQLNWKVVTDEVSEVIEFGIRKKWFFRIMDEKGVIEKPILKSNWYYVPIEADCTIIPKEALDRLEAVKTQFHICQVIVGHEIVEAPEVQPEIEMPAIPWKGIGLVVGALALGLVYVLVSAVSCIADPCLIVVLEDGTWISICEWLG